MFPSSSQESEAEPEPPGMFLHGEKQAEAPLLINRQRAVRGDWREVRTFLAQLSSRVARSGFSVCLLSDRGIRRYNRRFRRRDEATDVLSFPAGNGRTKQENNLGDILISAETARENARRYGLRLEQEIQVLALHGVLHLLGYDHERDEGHMARLERRWSRELGLPQPLTGRGRHRRSRQSS